MEDPKNQPAERQSDAGPVRQWPTFSPFSAYHAQFGAEIDNQESLMQISPLGGSLNIDPIDPHDLDDEDMIAANIAGIMGRW